MFKKKFFRHLAALLAVMLLLCALPAGLSLAETAPTVGSSSAYINASGVNFRTGPSTKYSSQGKLSLNTAVTVTGTSGNWYKITVDSTGKSGYVFSRYVTLSTSPVDPTTPVSGTAGYINGSGINFRTGPSTKYSSQGKLSVNTAVTVTGTSGSWYKLTVDSTGKSGYVFSRYVTLSTSPVTPTTGTAGTINTANVHFRTGPSTSYASQGLLAQGTAVTVNGSSGSWYKITLDANGKTGYVYASYVTLGSSPAAPTSPVAPTTEQIGYVNGRSVNFRTGPSTKYKSIGLLRRDAVVTVLGSSGNWYKIRAEATGQVGYMYASYVTLGTSPSSSAAPTVPTAPNASATPNPGTPSTTAPQAPIAPVAP